MRADCLGAALCEARAAPGGAAATVESLGGACSGRERPGPDAVARQSLFNVYVHANPDFQGYGPKSPFHGRIIPDELRMQTGWGEHSTTEVSFAHAACHWIGGCCCCCLRRLLSVRRETAAFIR